MCSSINKFLSLSLLVFLLYNNVASHTASRHKRGIYGLDSNGPYLPAPFGPVPFAPFGLGSPFAQPPFALPYQPYGPPPYAAASPNLYPLPPWYPPPHPYQNPIFAPRPPPYFPPVVAPAAPVGPPPAPIIVPAKTAAALSIASIIHAFIARKFYPPVLPVPITRPVPVTVPYPVPERATSSTKNQRRTPGTTLKPIPRGSQVIKDPPENRCVHNSPNIIYESSFSREITTSTPEITWQPTMIPINRENVEINAL